MAPTDVCPPPCPITKPCEDVFSDDSIECDENPEWYVDLTDWQYDHDDDITYIRYTVCVYPSLPFDTCSDLDSPEPLTKFSLQIPCACEICIDEATKDMSPDGYATEIHQGWIWDYTVYPGECQNFDLALYGYVNLRYGELMLENSYSCRYHSSTNFVPDPCKYMKHDYHDYNNQVWYNQHNNSYECNRVPDWPDQCHYECQSDDNDDTEWSIMEGDVIYDSNNDVTTFSYIVSVDDENTNIPCSMTGLPYNLEEVVIRIGCDCNPANDYYLQSITDGVSPYSTLVTRDSWAWNEQNGINLEPGNNRTLTITLSGDWSDAISDSGDVILGGNMRCKYYPNIRVPNVCHRNELFGQWTEWIEEEECDADCGGGVRKLTRTCVSVEDPTTEVINCPGEDTLYQPCNTQQCPDGHHHSHHSKSWTWSS